MVHTHTHTQVFVQENQVFLCLAAQFFCLFICLFMAISPAYAKYSINLASCLYKVDAGSSLKVKYIACLEMEVKAENLVYSAHFF